MSAPHAIGNNHHPKTWQNSQGLQGMPHMPPTPSYRNADGSPMSDAQRDSANREYDLQMLRYKDELGRYNTRLQVLQQNQTEEQVKISNMHKARHDVMMAIIGNMK